MTALFAISALFALLGIVFLLRAFHSARHGRVVRAGGSGVSCLLCGAIAGIGTLLILGVVSYERLTDEQLVSRIEFSHVSENEYRARLMIPGKADQFFVLRGDEWQLDARIVTWAPPLTILGLDPVYKLDRLSGRYTDVEREKSAARTVYALHPDAVTDLWRFKQRFPVLLPGVDAHYGTATYVPMADGARFEVTLSRDALIARPDNDNARAAVRHWNEN